jgi:CBS domain-containing protein
MSPTPQRIIEALGDSQRPTGQGTVVAEQVMTANPTCVRPTTAAAGIIKLLYTESFHHLLVTDDDGRLVGVLSDRDVVRCFCRGGNGKPGGVAAVTAADIMSTDLVTIEPRTPLVDAVGLMRDWGISCLPVMAGETPLGILTDTDLAAVLHTLMIAMDDDALREAVAQAVANLAAVTA